MTFDLQRILANKRAYRKRLATLPIGEKLRLLDALRERELAIRGSILSSASRSSAVREDSPRYPTKPK
jgi:hypothetical protein